MELPFSPIEKATSAIFIAGVSFVPSPVTATIPPLYFLVHLNPKKKIIKKNYKPFF